MALEIVSIHVPKTAGISFRRTLQAAYGDEAVLLDYGDDPADPCSQRNLDPDSYCERAKGEPIDAQVRVIHGHFHAAKYDHIQGVKRIAFLRDPLENFLSIYYYWRQHPVEVGHALFHYVRQHNLGLVDMARLPTFRRLYSHVYFGGFDLECLDFIGFTETYSEDLHRLSLLLEQPLVEHRDNLNPHTGYKDEVRAVCDKPAVMAQLRNLLIEDLRFYDSAKAIADRRHLCHRSADSRPHVAA